MPKFRLATPKPLVTITAFLQANFYIAVFPDPLPFRKGLDNVQPHGDHHVVWPCRSPGKYPLLLPLSVGLYTNTSMSAAKFQEN